MTRDVFIGIGSNMGDRLAVMGRAIEAIAALDDTHIISVSMAVETEPWGVTNQPPFANAVARVSTTIPADRLLVALKEIEVSLGRREAVRNGPRPIDLDILLCGDDEWETPSLRVPHPRLLEREFVVVPLLSVAPHVTMPDGTPITLEKATEGHVLGTLGPIPGFEEMTPPLEGWPQAGIAEDPAGWAEVASAMFSAGQGSAFALELLFDAAVLEGEGISIGWDPMPPQEEYSPWALPRTYRLLVPIADAERARELLGEAHGARGPQEPDWLGKE